MGWRLIRADGDEAGVPGVAYRRLLPTDARAYREFRLEALQLAPAAFGACHEEERAKGESDFAGAIERNFIIGCWCGDAVLVGAAGMFLRPGAKLRHKAVMFGLFVAPDHRGAGVGSALVDRIIAEARTVAEALQLSVATSSVAALSLYRSRGFRDYGLERRALKLVDDYVDEHLMELTFDAC